MKAFRIAVISSIPPKTGDALWLRPDEQGTFGLYYPRPGGWHPLYLETNITEEDFNRIQAALEEAVMNNYPTKEEVESTYVPNTGGLFTGSVVFNEDVIVKDDVRIVGELAVQGRIILTGTSRIKGITTPVDNDEATNKEYVDNAVNGIEDTMREYVSEQTYTKAEVDQKIQTETATFRGTYDTWDDVPTNVYDFPGDAVDNNDYIVVRDSTGYGVTYVGTWRFKYSGSGAYSKTNWFPEYQINEEPLTPSQEAAINSGITDIKVAKLDALPTNSELQSTYMPKSGGTFTGSVSMGNNKITNVGTPANSSDAAPKGYVDTRLSGKQDTLVSGTNIKTINGLSILGSGELTKRLTPSSTPPSKRWIVAPQGVSICISSVHDVLLLDSDANMSVVHLLGSETYVAKVVKYQNEVYLAVGEFGDDEVDIFPTHRITELNFNKIDVVSDSDFDVLATVAVKFYQDKLISGTNIKKFAGRSLLGAGDATISIEGDMKYAIFPDDEMSFMVWHPGGNGFGIVQTGAHFRAWNYGGFIKHICKISDVFAIEVDAPHAYVTFMYGSWNGTPTSRAASDVVSDPGYVSYDDRIIDSVSKDYSQNDPTNGEYIKNRPGGFDLPISNSYCDVMGSFSDAGDGYFFISDSDLPQADRSTLLTLLYTGYEIPVTVNYMDDPMSSVIKYVPNDDTIIIPNPDPSTLSSFTDLELNYYDIPGYYENDMQYYVAVQFPSKYIPKELPSGGTAGQVLAKASGTDYDVEWANGGGGDTSDCVKYTQQSKTDNEKTTARTNIGITLHDDVIDVTPDPPIAVSYGKMGVISQTQTWSGSGSNPRTYVMSNLVTGLIPQANIDLFERAGATFNSTTGYFEMNGLTDISYNEMMEIYGYKGVSDIAGKMGGDTLRNLTSCPRTLFPITQNINNTSYVSFLRVNTTGSNVSKIEAICIGKADTDMLLASSIEQLIYSCHYLKSVGINGSIVTTSTASTTNFSTSCYNLENIKIRGLGKNIGFYNSSLLSAESVAFIISHAGTATITITLHATAYARAIADADVQAALQSKTNVSLASA